MAPTPRPPALARDRRRSVPIVLAALLGVLASMFVAVGPASATTLPPRTALERHIGWVVDALINTERRLHHLPAVHMNSKLQLSARRHNITMARYNTMSHQLPGEAYFARRMTRAGYRWNYAGENIAWNSAMNQAGVLLLETLMYNERPPDDGHRLNILNPHYRDVGVDVYFDRKHHKVWLTTDYGRR